MIVIAYYTDNYKKHAARLVDSCREFGIDYRIENIPSKGKWLDNCAYKPTFIKAMLKKLKQPVLYVDADAEFKEYPKLLDYLECDIAYHTIDWGSIYESRRGDFELLSGTLYFNDTKPAHDILDEWESACDGTRFDQLELDRIMNAKRGYMGDLDLRVYDLGSEYCHIKDFTKGTPVILHHQASREAKAIELQGVYTPGNGQA